MKLRRTSRRLLGTFFFFLLLFTFSVWGLNQILGGSTPTIRSGTVLTVPLQGPIGESPQQGFLGAAVTVREIDEALRRAATDQRVNAVLLEIGPLAGGYGKAQEVRPAGKNFKPDTELVKKVSIEWLLHIHTKHQIAGRDLIDDVGR